MTTQAIAQMPELNPQSLISIVHDELRTSSHKVAESFGKQHRDLVRKIKSLDCSDQFLTANFCAVKFKHRGNQYDAYEMTKDGFMFLVMGFTGKQAARIKEAYINAFNWMADQLQQKGNRLESLPRVEYRGKRVITFEMIDHAHQSAARHASKRFYDHASEMLENLDYYKVPYSEREQMASQGVPVHVRGAIVLTQSGYKKLVARYTAPGVPFVRQWLEAHYFASPQAAVNDEELKVLRRAFDLCTDWLSIQRYASSDAQRVASLFEWRMDMADFERLLTSTDKTAMLPLSSDQAREALELLQARVALERSARIPDVEYVEKNLLQQLDELKWAQRWKLV
ncbi:MAG: Rha family transcriptional regulator [Amphritea sp.]|nr:Rha family transcriptional regulator [Amphritea sp.]